MKNLEINLDTLKDLTAAVGICGDEREASAVALKYLKKYDPDASIDVFGNVLGGIFADSALPTLLLDAHIDEIGMIVTYIDDEGFIKAGRGGGIDRRILPAASVTVHGTRPLAGVVCVLPPHVAKDSDKVIEEKNIAVDVGFSKEELARIVSPGDRITIDGGFTELLNNQVSARALDDRAGVYSLLLALEKISRAKENGAEQRYNIRVVFSVQEENGGVGAPIAAYSSGADEAISVDVSFASTPLDSDERECGKMGGGVMIGYSPILNRDMFEKMKALAKAKNIAHQIEIMPGKTGTNADDIATVKTGIRTVTLSIPEKNMHTPTEVLLPSDADAVAELIAAYSLA